MPPAHSNPIALKIGSCPFASDRILFFELNTPRNLSFFSAMGLLCAGILSLFVALIGFQVSGLSRILGRPPRASSKKPASWPRSSSWLAT